MWLKYPALRLKEEQLEAVTNYLSWILSSLNAFYTLIQSFHLRTICRADSLQYIYEAPVLDCPFYTHQALPVHPEAWFPSSHKATAGIPAPCLAPAAGHCRAGILGMGWAAGHVGSWACRVDAKVAKRCPGTEERNQFREVGRGQHSCLICIVLFWNPTGTFPKQFWHRYQLLPTK